MTQAAYRRVYLVPEGRESLTEGKQQVLVRVGSWELTSFIHKVEINFVCK